MSRTGVGVRVVIDGNTIDDGSLNANWGISADEGLRITWGRNSTMDQPESSTCTMRLTDIPGDHYFRTFGIGSTVMVIADAEISGGATLSAFNDPNFESEFRYTGKGITGGRTVENDATTAYLTPDPGRVGWTANLPPGPIQATGLNPTAWLGIPALSPGQTWTLEAVVRVPAGVMVEVRPLIYSAPWDAASRALEPIASVRGSGEWETVSGSVAPGATGGWMGVQLVATGAGETWGQVPANATWADALSTGENRGAPASWQETQTVWISRVGILAPDSGLGVETLVFGGRITDMETRAIGDYPQIDITASDFLADLGNRFVGDEPWQAEDLQTRVLRVLRLARAGNEQPVSVEIPATIANRIMTYEDVDNRSAVGLLQDMAVSVDAVLWSATHLASGPFIKMEDPGERPPLSRLSFTDSGTITIVPVSADESPENLRPTDISACDVLRDPVQFLLDVSDIATRTTVTWQEQTVDEQGDRTTVERTYRLIDGGREIAYGTRNVSVQTLLTTREDAQLIADRLLARSTGAWRMDGLEVSDAYMQSPDANAAMTLLELLDGIRRGGAPLRISHLPLWSPLGVTAVAYLEGGEYTFTGGGWELKLNISRAAGLGSAIQWDQMPNAWQWDQFSPAITWDDLHGVAVSEGENNG